MEKLEEEQIVETAGVTQYIKVLNLQITNDFRVLRDELELRDKALWEKLETIEKRLDRSESTSSEIIVIEEMSKEEAKQKVLGFMKEHKTSDIAELHKRIRCDGCGTKFLHLTHPKQIVPQDGAE